MMHPDLTAAVARERIADAHREARARAARPAVDTPAGHGPGGGTPSTRLDLLLRFLGGPGAADSWIPRPRASAESRR